jgi:hypothetical protein
VLMRPATSLTTLLPDSSTGLTIRMTLLNAKSTKTKHLKFKLPKKSSQLQLIKTRAQRKKLKQFSPLLTRLLLKLTSTALRRKNLRLPTSSNA